MNNGDIITTVILSAVFWFVVFLCLGGYFFGQNSHPPKWEENKENLLVIAFWPITLLLLTPVILIGAIKGVFGFFGWIGSYCIGIKNLYKGLVSR